MKLTSFGYASLGNRFRVALTLLAASTSTFTQAQVSPSPYIYSRTSSFTYQANGLLASETIEPGRPDLCVVTTYIYDSYGNKTSASTANCAGATGLNLFDGRTSNSAYVVQSGNLGAA